MNNRNVMISYLKKKYEFEISIKIQTDIAENSGGPYSSSRIHRIPSESAPIFIQIWPMPLLFLLPVRVTLRYFFKTFYVSIYIRLFYEIKRADFNSRREGEIGKAQLLRTVNLQITRRGRSSSANGQQSFTVVFRNVIQFN